MTYTVHTFSGEFEQAFLFYQIFFEGAMPTYDHLSEVQ